MRSETKRSFEQMERGLYRLADAKPLSNPDLVTVALKSREASFALSRLWRSIR